MICRPLRDDHVCKMMYICRWLKMHTMRDAEKLLIRQIMACRNHLKMTRMRGSLVAQRP